MVLGTFHRQENFAESDPLVLVYALLHSTRWVDNVLKFWLNGS